MLGTLKSGFKIYGPFETEEEAWEWEPDSGIYPLGSGGEGDHPYNFNVFPLLDIIGTE